MKDGYTRKELSREMNIGSETLRYYEKIGLIPQPKRTESGYRLYSEDDLLRIKFIVTAKGLGFSLSEISAFLKMMGKDDNNNHQHLARLLSEKINDINKKIEELMKLREALNYTLSNTDLGECSILKLFYENDLTL